MIFEKLKDIIAEQFSMEKEDITMDTTFKDDINADSLDVVELSMALEEQFGIEEMTEEEMKSITTVGDLVEFLQKKVED